MEGIADQEQRYGKGRVATGQKRRTPTTTPLSFLKCGGIEKEAQTNLVVEYSIPRGLPSNSTAADSNAIVARLLLALCQAGDDRGAADDGDLLRPIADSSEREPLRDQRSIRGDGQEIPPRRLAAGTKGGEDHSACISPSPTASNSMRII
ncbi:hypothetical protein HPP92_020217 [Vanilla planifolia]|uniref:Uncharacterized protein n=1 Tax=Vanilla planifolia TaxID=51239 RepID=A0A835Q808_VANPL|nr:hypothetical protein HPP92_020217 [Vanilla planifolia]